MPSPDNQQWLMSGLDLIFEKVMMNVCLNSLESLHRLPEHLGEPEQEENYQNYGPCHLIELFQESIILNFLTLLVLLLFTFLLNPSKTFLRICLHFVFVFVLHFVF